MIDPVGSFADGSGSGSAKLEFQAVAKKKACVESVYSQNLSYKKSKKPDVTSVVIDSLAGSFSGHVLQSDCDEHKVSWDSKVKSEDVSISGVFDIENMNNMVAKETSYMDSNASETDNIAKFVGSNQLSLVVSCVLEKRSFKLVKLFALNVELFAVSGKTNKIIRALFTSEFNMKKAKELAICKKIIEIPINLLRLVIESVFFKFALVEFESSDLVLVGKNSVRVVLAVNDKKLWVVRNCHWALLYILFVSMMAYDLSDLLELYGGKTRFIGHNPSLYVHDKYAIVCFVDKTSKLVAIGSILVFKGVNLCWAGLSLAHCAHCKQFGHISIRCSLSRNSGACSKRVKQAPIVCPVFFSGKTWAQVASDSSFQVVLLNFSGVGSSSGAKPVLLVSNFLDNSCLVDRLASLEHSLELLANQVSDILIKLSFVKLVPLASSSQVFSLVVVVSVTANMNSDMALNNTMVSHFLPLSVVADLVVDLSSSSSKVLTTKVGGLESKIVALKVSVESVLEKLDHFEFMWKFVTCNICGINVSAKQKNIICWHKDSGNLVLIITETKLKSSNRLWIKDKFSDVRVFSSGLDKDFLGAGVTIIMNIFLARHVSKIFEVPGWLFLVKLLFKNKLSVSILGLYAGVSLAVCFSQSNNINSIIAKVVNESSFVVLDLGLVNSLSGSSCVKKFTWANSWSMAKTIDFLFIFSNLVNAVVDHEAVFMFVGLGGLLDKQLNFLHKQVNRDQWKFEFKGANKDKWNNFKGATLANAAMFSNVFPIFARFSNLNAIWNTIRKIMFRGFDDVFTKESSRFYRLELLVSKIVRASYEGSIVNFNSFIRCWISLDNVKASVIQDIVNSGAGVNRVHSALFGARKSYCAAKLVKSLRAKEAHIRSAIDRRMESFKVDKGRTIRSVLEYPFHKVTLNHLVVDNNLILESDLVKTKVDVIMENWTRKCEVVDDISGKWHHQYQPLEYVFDQAFSEVMCLIKFDKLVNVVFDLPNGKAAGLSGVSNKLWKHCDKSVLDMLLVLLNSCLSNESVSSPWKKT
ncbi:hypothetical protein G9A89_020936 [Geosiphon pyriformis]|nr:hypothetical protein G9A89_020936 [Geosiphon pyriformis]